MATGNGINFDIPETCKAGVTINTGPGFHVEIQDVEVPQPGPGELLVKLNVTGLCHSDVNLMSGKAGIPLPTGIRSAGHEGAGIVVKLGDGVKDWKVGDRAGIKPIRDVCGTCDLCTDEMENYCPKRSLTGITSLGTYQQYVTSPAKYTTRIPEGVLDHVAAPIMCGGLTAYGSLENSGLKSGNWVAIVGGAGGVGIQGVQIATATGFRPVVIDTEDNRRDLAVKLGAVNFIDFKTSPNVAEDLKRICGGIGPHAVLVTSPAAYKDAISYIGNRIGGKVLCVGLSPTAPIVGTQPNLYVWKNLTVSGTAMGTSLDCDQVLKFAQQGFLQAAACEVRPLRLLPESIQQLHRGEVAGRIVIDFNA